jgi:hypothetical protein
MNLKEIKSFVNLYGTIWKLKLHFQLTENYFKKNSLLIWNKDREESSELKSLLDFHMDYIRGGQPKLVSGPQLRKFAKNLDFLGHNMTKNWENTLKSSKNRWFSIRVWAADWPPLDYTKILYNFFYKSLISSSKNWFFRNYSKFYNSFEIIFDSKFQHHIQQSLGWNIKNYQI